MSHRGGLDPSVLVGDGGRSYHRRQQKRLRERERDEAKSSKSSNPSNPSNTSNAPNNAAPRHPTTSSKEQTALSKKQEKSRLKRLKKKERKQKHKQANQHSSHTSNTSNTSNTSSNTSNASSSLSNFLYGGSGSNNDIKNRNNSSDSSKSTQNFQNSQNSSNNQNTRRSSESRDDVTHITLTVDREFKSSPRRQGSQGSQEPRNQGSDRYQGQRGQRGQQQQQQHKIEYVSNSNQARLNAVSADMLKAQLRGDDTRYNELKLELEQLRAQGTIITTGSNNSVNSNNSNNNRNNCNYRSNRNNFNSSLGSNGSNGNNGNTGNANVSIITDTNISRSLHNLEDLTDVREDDDVATLLRKERHRSGADYARELMQSKSVRKTMNLDLNDQFDSVDTTIVFGSNSNNSNSSSNSSNSNTNGSNGANAVTGRKRGHESRAAENEERRKRRRLIGAHRRQEEWLARCVYCADTEAHRTRLGHMVMSSGRYFYLTLPAYRPLMPHMSVIVPRGHIESTRLGIFASEDVGASMQEQEEFEKEYKLLQERVVECYEKQLNAGAVFIETCKNLSDNRSNFGGRFGVGKVRKYHTIVECYPIEKKKGSFDVVRSYFKKAILEECDSLWQTNKKLVEVTKERPLKRCIPENMSYFYVQFGLHEGFAHIIEDETKFELSFGRDVIAGLMEEVLFRTNRNESYQEQMKRVNQFENIWADFDPFEYHHPNANMKHKHPNPEQIARMETSSEKDGLKESETVIDSKEKQKT